MRQQLVGRAERVTRTLNEQYRNCDIRQMLRTKLVCATRGMKRIAEEDEPFDVGCARGSNLGGDLSAHRFAANDQRAAAQAGAYKAVLDRIELWLRKSFAN